MPDKDLEARELGLFDASEVTWEVLDSKKRNEFTVKFTCDGTFNLIKQFLAIEMLAEKLRQHLNILDQASDDEH